MTDTVKRGPGRPKATVPVEDTELKVGDIVTRDVETGEYVVELEPVIDKKLVFQGGYLGWQPIDAVYVFSAPIAYGWSDGIVTWKDSRG